MADAPQDLSRLAPDKLVVGFSRSKILLCLLIAIGVHLVLIGVTSVGYVRDRWIDPEGAARRKAEQLAARRAAEATPAAPATQAPAAARPAGSSATGTAAAKPKTETTPDARKDTPVVREITELPKEGEIPKKPNELGISIEETNR